MYLIFDENSKVIRFIFLGLIFLGNSKYIYRMLPDNSFFKQFNVIRFEIGIFLIGLIYAAGLIIDNFLLPNENKGEQNEFCENLVVNSLGK